MKEVILTAEGYEKLKSEIEYLSNEKRREVADRIRIAREFGDIAENSEYDDAKNEQAMLEHRIALLEERLLAARVISKGEVSKDTVSVGSRVRLGVELSSLEQVSGGVQAAFALVFELEGKDKPCCVGELLLRFVRD